jgi:hypothetical protein
LRSLENQAGIGGCVLRGVFADGLKVAGVGNDGRVLSQGIEMTTHVTIEAQISGGDKSGSACGHAGWIGNTLAKHRGERWGLK